MKFDEFNRALIGALAELHGVSNSELVRRALWEKAVDELPLVRLDKIMRETGVSDESREAALQWLSRTFYRLEIASYGTSRPN